MVLLTSETVVLAVGVATTVSVLLGLARHFLGHPLVFGHSEKLVEADMRALKMAQRASEMEVRALEMEQRALAAEAAIQQFGARRELWDLAAAALEELGQRKKKPAVEIDAKTAQLIQLAVNNDNPNESAAAAIAACKRIAGKS